jgi:hypothetical protein
MGEGSTRGLTWLILLAAFLAGVACCAILPPFEGADETAHWSYLQQLSDTGRAPIPGRDALSADLGRYAGPHPYADAAPFDQTGFPTYRSFRLVHGAVTDAGPGRFAQGALPNWEAQHPPLYYRLLTPVYRALHPLPFRAHLFGLRLVSWSLAFAGLAIGVLATLHGPAWVRGCAPLMAAWPFILPQVFPTLARLGNDSLCLLLCGGLWAGLLQLETDRRRWPAVIGLGVLLGLGLLTKAFFLPIGVGLAAFLAFSGWRSGRLPRGVAEAAVVLALAAAIGGWWYLGQYQITHDLTGGGDFVNLQKQGGLAAGLAAHGSPVAILRGFAALAATFAWTGTWSLARPPEVLILGPLLLVGIPLIGWLRGLRGQPALAFAPLFLAMPLLASLAYHVFAFVALTGRGASTPGYYLHILAAPLAFAVALGWRRGPLLTGLWVYTGLFTLGVWALQLSMFSGCAAKLGDDPHYSFAGAGCLVDGGQISALSYPLLAALAIVAAVVALGFTLWRTPRPAPTEPTELIPL